MRYSLRFLLLLFSIQLFSQQTWKAPQEARKLENPFSGTAYIEKGRSVFKSFCTACHGISGRGDGVAAAGMNPKPADFTRPVFQNQTDGEIFWKLTHGRGAMASYKDLLSDEERWSIVCYLRTLKVEDENIQETTHPSGAFVFTQLVNAQTPKLIPAHSLEFTIQHRFGATQADKNIVNNFLGLDLASNIRFALAYGITDRLQAEIGRTKFGKYYDISLKYRLFEQGDKYPVNLSVYSATAIMSDKFPELEEDAEFSGGEEFEYKSAHRLVYTNEFVFSRKLNDNFSFLLGISGIWRNLAPDGEKNFLLTTPAGLRWKVSPKGSILFEAIPQWLNGNKLLPLSLGYEIASSGAHVFQCVISNTEAITGQAVACSRPYDITKGNFLLGFNIKRIF